MPIIGFALFRLRGRECSRHKCKDLQFLVDDVESVEEFMGVQLHLRQVDLTAYSIIVLQCKRDLSARSEHEFHFLLLLVAGCCRVGSGKEGEVIAIGEAALVEFGVGFGEHFVGVEELELGFISFLGSLDEVGRHDNGLLGDIGDLRMLCRLPSRSDCILPSDWELLALLRGIYSGA